MFLDRFEKSQIVTTELIKINILILKILIIKLFEVEFDNH